MTFLEVMPLFIAPVADSMLPVPMISGRNRIVPAADIQQNGNTDKDDDQRSQQSGILGCNKGALGHLSKLHHASNEINVRFVQFEHRS